MNAEIDDSELIDPFTGQTFDKNKALDESLAYKTKMFKETNDMKYLKFTDAEKARQTEINERRSNQAILNYQSKNEVMTPVTTQRNTETNFISKVIQHKKTQRELLLDPNGPTTNVEVYRPLNQNDYRIIEQGNNYLASRKLPSEYRQGYNGLTYKQNTLRKYEHLPREYNHHRITQNMKAGIRQFNRLMVKNGLLDFQMGYNGKTLGKNHENLPNKQQRKEIQRKAIENFEKATLADQKEGILSFSKLRLTTQASNNLVKYNPSVLHNELNSTDTLYINQQPTLRRHTVGTDAYELLSKKYAMPQYDPLIKDFLKNYPSGEYGKKQFRLPVSDRLISFLKTQQNPEVRKGFEIDKKLNDNQYVYAKMSDNTYKVLNQDNQAVKLPTKLNNAKNNLSLKRNSQEPTRKTTTYHQSKRLTIEHSHNQQQQKRGRSI